MTLTIGHFGRSILAGIVPFEAFSYVITMCLFTICLTSSFSHLHCDLCWFLPVSFLCDLT